MRFIDMAIFLLICNLFGGILAGQFSDIGITEFSSMTYDEQSAAQDLKSDVETQMMPGTVSAQDPVTTFLGIIYEIGSSALRSVTGFFEKYIFWLPIMLKNLGMPTAFVIPLGVIMLVIEILGIYQLVTGKYFEGAT